MEINQKPFYPIIIHCDRTREALKTQQTHNEKALGLLRFSDELAAILKLNCTAKVGSDEEFYLERRWRRLVSGEWRSDIC